MAYPRTGGDAVPASPDLPGLERSVLEYWAGDGTFEASVGRHEPGPDEYVFYDGPPFANGLPHYGHLLTGYVKDLVPRYQTMRGRRVERRFGWDCHGLPAEVETERQVGVSGRREIMEYGVAAFNDACRTSVLRYTMEWERYVTRQALFWGAFLHSRCLPPWVLTRARFCFGRLDETPGRFATPCRAGFMGRLRCRAPGVAGQ